MTTGVNENLILSVGSIANKRRDVINVRSIIPDNLHDPNILFVTLLEKYYEWMNSRNSGTNAISNLYKSRSIDDSVIAEDFNTFKQFVRELMIKFSPREIQLNIQTALKNITSLYSQKGSDDGIESFFRLLFDTSSTVYYPWTDVLIASDGEWDGTNQAGITIDGASTKLAVIALSKGEFKSNSGFLSDLKYLQDSWYWQRFSYDIRVSQPPVDWLNSFLGSMHPAGFKLFSSLVLLLIADVKIPTEQIGLIEELLREIPVRLLITLSQNLTPIGLVFIAFDYLFLYNIFNRSVNDTFNRLLNMNRTESGNYSNLIIEDMISGNHNYNIGSFITQS